MGLWAIFFLGAAWLHLRGVLRLEPLPMLALALLLLLPLPRSLRPRRQVRFARHLAALLFAAALVWRASWIPPPARAWRLFTETGGGGTGGGMSLPYFVRLGLGVLAPTDALALAAIVAGCILLARRVSLVPLALAGVAAVALDRDDRADPGLDAALARFFEAESRRAVSFPAPLDPARLADVDVVLLHVCSMSWDDLRASGLDHHPLLARFDVVLDAFNSVSSYTNPSMIRLLRAPCGQPRHAELAREARPECYLLDALRRAGYRTWTAIDNDAPAYRFVEEASALGHADPPMPLAGVPVRQVDFDGTPIHDDLALLARWLDVRARAAAPRAALYADLTTLHSGAHRVEDAAWWRRSRVDLYREAGERLFASVETFLEALRASRRRTLVVLVAEHGIALRGSPFQPPELRELPFPEITLVPAAVALVGPGLPSPPPHRVRIDRPTSYLALAHLVARALERPDPEALVADAAQLPETPFVAENEAAIVLRRGDDVFWRAGSRGFARAGPGTRPR
jgi:cellulose synthase operon protein YhjU